MTSTMKLTAITSLLIPVTATAISCGNLLTKACLGESDPRYDPEASNALQDQADVYKIKEGYSNCTWKTYDGTGNPIIGYNPFGYTQSDFPFYTYMNNTFRGSRSIVLPPH
jgi:hypothetical protein